MHSNKYIVAVVDGIVGAGKTTLIKALSQILSREGWRITVIKEPVDKWVKSGLLQAFYEDPVRNAYMFQTVVFHDRVRECQEQHRKYREYTDVFLMERSIFTDLLFMEVMHDDQSITTMERDSYLQLWEMWREVMPFEPDLFIYLRPDLDTAMERLRSGS